MRKIDLFSPDDVILILQKTTISVMSQLTVKKSLFGKLKDKYRFVVLDDDTLGEIKSARISGFSVLIGLTLLILIVGLLTAALMSFTPLRYLVPGYAEVTNNMAYMDLVEKMNVIESELEAQKVYTDGMKHLLNPTGISLEEKEKLSELGLHNDKTPGAVGIEDYYFVTPVRGELSAPFNLDKKHFGIDIVAEKDSPIKSVKSGVVISVEKSEANGNTISVQHDNNLISIYKHNSAVLKKVGESVSAGDAIAIIGDTGEHSTGPHVHLELWYQGRAVDPMSYLNFE